MKAFAIGVILATGYAHMLSDGIAALSDPCFGDSVWSKFPFLGFVAMMASLGTLMVEFVETQFYERSQGLACSEPKHYAPQSVLSKVQPEVEPVFNRRQI